MMTWKGESKKGEKQQLMTQILKVTLVMSIEKMAMK
jgi:hypothetical protein